MTKRKVIKIRTGETIHLAKMCGVSRRTVYNALHWHSDTTAENKVRECAKKYFLKRF